MTKVLVVDDEQGYRSSLDFFLSQAGFEVLTVAGLAEAVEQAPDFRPDILVADWLLEKKKTGAELARALLQQFADLKVILMTGLGAGMVREQLGDLEVLCLIEKPFEPRSLIDAVRAAAAGDESTHGSVGS